MRRRWVPFLGVRPDVADLGEFWCVAPLVTLMQPIPRGVHKPGTEMRSGNRPLPVAGISICSGRLSRRAPR